MQMDRSAVSPAVIAHRLCDILQTFPAAASSGVQWETLRRKYKEVHSAELDIAALGHSSALAGASSLLWEVLRVVDGEDVDNPVLAVEQGVALTPRPGYLVTWPSLYAACCTAVESNGIAEGPGSEVRGLLLSQLKPLLQNLWHPEFTECGLKYESGDGRSVRPKKMKHIVTALLHWREEYMETRGERKHCLRALDKALEARLELVASSTRNDLILRFWPVAATSPSTRVAVETAPVQKQRTLWSDVDSEATDELWHDQTIVGPTSPTTPSSKTARSDSSFALEHELSMLRAENAALRGHNERLLIGKLFQTSSLLAPTFQPEVFDDPFEPPPESPRCKPWAISSGASTATPNGYGSGVPSGMTTPMSNVGAPSFGLSLSGQLCTLMPAFNAQIPCGIVQQARSFFEKADEAIPSFFAQKTF
jgi:hypothetical protein